jgi:hypothetical protein
LRARGSSPRALLKVAELREALAAFEGQREICAKSSRRRRLCRWRRGSRALDGRVGVAAQQGAPRRGHPITGIAGRGQVASECKVAVFRYDKSFTVRRHRSVFAGCAGGWRVRRQGGPC